MKQRCRTSGDARNDNVVLGGTGDQCRRHSAQDLAGYKIHYGIAPGSYIAIIDVDDVLTYTVQNLASGTSYFVITAYDTSGNENAFSNEASKTIP